jgi:hypothetical protein
MEIPNLANVCEASLPQQLLGELVCERGAVVAMVHYLGDEVATDGILIPHHEIILPAALIGCDGQVEVWQAQAQYAARLQHPV